jgi:hypothetical protein
MQSICAEDNPSCANFCIKCLRNANKKIEKKIRIVTEFAQKLFLSYLEQISEVFAY